jgi:prepilin-type N-terminal cleavage/methylation domain-containing protein
MKSLKKSEKGFTLIEVVIVLAIAAGIILIVLLAIAGANRSSRDTKRVSLVGNLAAGIEQYAGNHDGNLPTNQAGINTIIGTPLKPEFADPLSGTGPKVTGAVTAANPVVYNYNRVCVNNAASATGATTRTWAITYWNENSSEILCRDNK